MRWLESDLDEGEDKPYKEGDVHICRNCACPLSYCAAYCYACRRLRRSNADEELDTELES
jgi:hypothetical protein